ncbi:MAG TPA: TIGR00730 family Rossman fold protein [Pseudonocardiaceae bacterium]|jgi:hypothetical protein|nr:TIGR00730 family Rossman fold protein [Pseudonocardiaceae bacterium]
MRICVYCGSSPGRGKYGETARLVGQTLAERGITVVYGGGRVGTMGALADGALAAGGEVVGVIPQHLVDREVGHQRLTELHVVTTLHERKALMADLADAFLTLPGGAGTMDEMFESWTWSQLGLHEKPIGLLDVGGYFQHLLRFVDHMIGEGFLKQRFRDILVVDEELDRLLDRCVAYQPPSHTWADMSPPAP